ncbi:MAG: hypothetical protein HYZ50_22295 [Deltaproteobacteria bacterium]|nr:hypothetical protein [Deltaproteobacteria bacterium]
MNEKTEKLVERRVTYTLEHEGKFYIVTNVPARVDEETGEQFFSPATVEQLQRMILGHGKPHRVLETPVYEYAE